MKKLFLLLAATLMGLSSFAHQTLVMVSGEEMEVEIVTMGTNDISYKKKSNPNGPTYTVARDKVFYIVMDNGEKEVITPMDAVNATPQTGSTPVYSAGNSSSNSLSGLVVKAADQSLQVDSVQPKKYYDHVALYPRASIGYQATGCGYGDYDIDWGGLAWSVDLNVLIPSGRDTAWSIGTGVCGLGGPMYLKSSKNKAKLGDMSAIYWTIPLEWFYKCGDWFTIGFGDRLEVLISQKCDGEKIKDMFTGFRDSLFMDGIVTIGNFDIGAQILFNLTRGIKGEDLSWSPTISASLVAGFRF